MKQSTKVIKKIFSQLKGLILDKEFLAYTFVFWALMTGLYIYMVYAGVAKAPEFTYAEF